MHNSHNGLYPEVSLAKTDDVGPHKPRGKKRAWSHQRRLAATQPSLPLGELHDAPSRRGSSFPRAGGREPPRPPQSTRFTLEQFKTLSNAFLAFPLLFLPCVGGSLFYSPESEEAAFRNPIAGLSGESTFYGPQLQFWTEGCRKEDDMATFFLIPQAKRLVSKAYTQHHKIRKKKKKKRKQLQSECLVCASLCSKTFYVETNLILPTTLGYKALLLYPFYRRVN